jgi:putative serine protease PepD
MAENETVPRTQTPLDQAPGATGDPSGRTPWWHPAASTPDGGADASRDQPPYGQNSDDQNSDDQNPYGRNSYDTRPLSGAGYGSPDEQQPPATPPPAAPRQRGGGAVPWRRTATGALALALVAGGSAAGGAWYATGRATPAAGAVTTASPVSVGSATTPTEGLAAVAAAVQPSVVSITVTTSSGGDEGSGIVLRSDGTIVTNNHVVSAAADGGGTIEVKFSDGTKAAATLVGRDPSVDLAVIKATGVSGLTPATLGDTSSVHVGDTVLALGSPLGLDGSVSAGIVSALHRTVSVAAETTPRSPFGQQQQSSAGGAVGDAIQTDAAVNPGNSGGPLVDSAGRVIGITTAIATLGSSSGQSGSIGLGFAIPVEQVRTTADALIAGRTPTHAVLGVSVADATGGTAASGSGALVDQVVAGGAAAKAGLAAGDVVTSVGGTPVENATDLSAAVRSHQPGDAVAVVYTRDGQSKTVQVTLGTAT